MERSQQLPPVFTHYAKMGGPVRFELFEDWDGTAEQIALAIRQSIGAPQNFDTTDLHALGPRILDRPTFFGDWFHEASGRLLKRGVWRDADGKEYRDPPLVKMEGIKTVSGSFGTDEPGSGGQFAYAFSEPPYGLKAKPSEVQRTFDSICAILFPQGVETQIRDWTTPDLVALSEWFRWGMEWWGIFLFTLEQPSLKRLWVLAASESD